MMIRDPESQQIFIYLLWYPVLVPQMLGGLELVCPATANVSVQAPVVEPNAKPENVWKSSLSWQMSSDTFSNLNVQVPALEAVYELG